jgi:hypothetical protein
MTLAESIDPKASFRKPWLVLVEHGRCHGPLGIHEAFVVEEDDGPTFAPSAIAISKGPWNREAGRHPPTRRRRPQRRTGALTTPGVLYEGRDVGGQERGYAHVVCACLPRGHEEKIRVEKIGNLQVTFPAWKWGRPIDLPVVTI